MKISPNLTPMGTRLKAQGEKIPPAYPQSHHADYVSLLGPIAQEEANEIRKTQNTPLLVSLAVGAGLSLLSQSLPLGLAPVVVGGLMTLSRRNQADDLEGFAQAMKSEQSGWIPGAYATLEAHEKVHGWSPWNTTFPNWYGPGGDPIVEAEKEFLGKKS